MHRDLLPSLARDHPPRLHQKSLSLTFRRVPIGRTAPEIPGWEAIHAWTYQRGAKKGAPGPLAIISERSSSATPSEIVVPYTGVPDVSLGDNNAAQIHVENSISDCVSGHWGTDGLGPPMRYSLAGSYQSNGENASGYDYCLTDEDRPSYRPIQSVQSELRDHMNGYLGSPGHKENILYQWHRKVNLGLSWDTHQMWTVQQFEGDYANCSVPPTIQGTTLSLSCTVSEVLPSRSLAQTIHYDSPPHALTQGQIARSYGYRFGRRVALLRQRAPARIQLSGRRGFAYILFRVHSLRCRPNRTGTLRPPRQLLCTTRQSYVYLSRRQSRCPG